ncbi:hypothetical protein BTVI_02554 [Pitangus sulphuratus]|nr:hypothetical protein BTVI_02554 [Pitangus sulphuratus]
MSQLSKENSTQIAGRPDLVCLPSNQPEFYIIYQDALFHPDDDIPKFALNILKNIEMHSTNIVHLKLAKEKDSQYDSISGSLEKKRKLYHMNSTTLSQITYTGVHG